MAATVNGIRRAAGPGGADYVFEAIGTPDTIAQAIAADMAVPFHVVEMLHINGPDALDAALEKETDPRVKQAEADQIVTAMQKKNIPVTYVLFPDEGHGIAKLPNRIKAYEGVVAFLAKYLK